MRRVIISLAILIGLFAPSTARAGFREATSTANAAGQVQLAWDANAAAEQVTKYWIGYRIGNGVETLVDAGNVTTFTVTGLTAGQTYIFRAYAENAGGRSGPSADVSESLPPDTPPSGCLANGKPYTITIAISSYTKQLAPGARGQVLFTLGNSFPVTRVQVKLGTQVVGEIPATDLRDLLGVGFSVPRIPGTYNLFVTATDSAGCTTSTTLARPVVVQ